MKENFLCIDFGNTLVKAGIFCNDELKEIFIEKKLSEQKLKTLISKFNIHAAIISSVSDASKNLEKMLKKIIPSSIILSEKFLLPIRNNYFEKKKLGKDRLASAVAASKIFPNKNVLAINCGTCIIYDFVNAGGEYLGGSISPGMEMRLQALHTFTNKLPKVKAEFPSQLIGNTTELSILSGVMNGIVHEMDGVIDSYKNEFKNVKVILSGGDSERFALHMKNKIFAHPHLVLQGLYQILKFNVHSVR